jgi:acetyl esterase/lipase
MVRHGQSDLKVRMLADVVYGRGIVGYTSPDGARDRELKLNLYLPVTQPPESGFPALVFAFGGAFHRGSKENDAFFGDKGNTPSAEYCRRIAGMGIATAAIDYRLVPEDPAPGDTLVVQDMSRIGRSRIDVVRAIMGLEPATNEQLWRGIEAAADDMAMAVQFVRQHASRWLIDRTRIAAGGYSAGARTALNVAFGERVSVAAVVSLSGAMEDLDLHFHTSNLVARPPVLLVAAENDVDFIVQSTPKIHSRLCAVGIACETVAVPDATHFYRSDAKAIHETLGLTTVFDAVTGFLGRALHVMDSSKPAPFNAENQL